MEVFRVGVVVCLAAAVSLAQTAAPEVRKTPAVAKAEQELGRVQALVEEGVLPRKALTEAEAALEEARDQEVLAASLYGQIAVEDLTEQQSEEMVAAAGRHWERQKQKLAAAQKLVDEGAMARAALILHLEELDRSRKTYDLAASRSRLLKELAAIVRAEQELESKLEEAPLEAPRFAERFDGDGVFLTAHLRQTILAFEREFGRALPISARGETALHRAMGFDHRGRVDVALNPDSREGMWLLRFLESIKVPYYAFRGFVAGKSTGAHVHIGPPSLRLRKTD